MHCNRIIVLALLLAVGGFAVAGSSYSTGFETGEGYTVGSTLYGQDGWSGGDWAAPPWNKIKAGEAVVSTVAHTGANSWYFPGGPTTEGPGTPMSPAVDGSGWPGGSGWDANTVGIGAQDHAAYNTVSATLWFKPHNTAGDDSALSIYQAALAGDDRTGFNLYIASSDTGTDIGTYRWSLTENTYAWEDIATGLSLDEWHSIDIDAVFKNDFLVDEITYTIDKGTAGEIVSTTGNTWTHPWFDENRDVYKPGAGLKFAWSRSAPIDAAGYYFDDISYSADLIAGVDAAVPEPISLIFFGTGVVGIAGFVARKRMRRSCAD